jgi:acetyl esterase/lipase
LSAIARETLLGGLTSIDLPTTYSAETLPAVKAAVAAEEAEALRVAHDRFHVHIEQARIDGVPVSVARPKDNLDPASVDERVILELHPGAFLAGEGHGLVESIALAAISRATVVSIQYRVAPESVFPAAVEDVVKVYRHYARLHGDNRIAIVGSSAGGLLGTQVVARLIDQSLAVPGAICMLGSGADARFDGDSRYTSPADGYGVSADKGILNFMWSSYFPGLDLTDSLISPALHCQMIASFPPSLLLTSTRAHELSSVIFTHRQLVRSGVETELHVWDGLPHCFYLDLRMPESIEAFETVARFLDRHLAK